MLFVMQMNSVNPRPAHCRKPPGPAETFAHDSAQTSWVSSLLETRVQVMEQELLQKRKVSLRERVAFGKLPIKD